MDWLDTLKKIAPTVATATLGPLAGAAVSALGGLLGIPDATQDKIAKAITNSQLTPEQVSELKKLELTYQENEKERGFKYSELAFKDRDSARQANVAGGTQVMLFWLSLMLLALCLGSEIYILFKGVPKELPEMVTGRILGLLDAVTLMVLTYWYGTTNGSQAKDRLLFNSTPTKD